MRSRRFRIGTLMLAVLILAMAFAAVKELWLPRYRTLVIDDEYHRSRINPKVLRPVNVNDPRQAKAIRSLHDMLIKSGIACHIE